LQEAHIIGFTEYSFVDSGIRATITNKAIVMWHFYLNGILFVLAIAAKGIAKGQDKTLIRYFINTPCAE